MAAVPRITDPQACPWPGMTTTCPGAPGLADAEALRQRFAGTRPWQPEIRGDGALQPGAPALGPAVLVPLVQRDDGLHVLLTRRTEHLRDHAGQISFPGGRSEPEDAEPWPPRCARREEEVGLARRPCRGAGPPAGLHHGHHYVVTPVVGLVHPPFELALDTFEVAEAFEVPLPS
jgi:8-oxo-dGTP pyrophosphatase MutT (NUDIX family)